MRFGVLVAAFAVLWVQPVKAVTVIDFENGTPGLAPVHTPGVSYRVNPVVVAGGPTGNYLHLEEYWNYSVRAANFRNYNAPIPTNQDTRLVGFDIRADQNGFMQIDGGELIPLTAGAWVRFENVVQQNLRFRHTDVSLDNIGYEFSMIHGIPEPATWAMMILGFGLIGAAMRSRPRSQAAI